MNFLFLILPKIINHKRLELFEFRQLEHVLKISFYCGSDFDSRKVQAKLGLARFCWFGGVVAKMGQTLSSSSFLQICEFRIITNSKTRYLKGDPLGFTQKAPLVGEF
jgi:hypothetical protein